MGKNHKQSESQNEYNSKPAELELVIDEPPFWTHNWVRNVNLIKKWTQSVLSMSKISKEDYDKVKAYKLMNIDDKVVREHLENGVSNFGLILPWIENGVNLVNICEHVPMNCALSVHNFMQYEKFWQEHITESYNADQLKELSAICKSLIEEIEKKLDIFDADGELIYSSYSDYSESSYESEEEEEEEEEEEDDDDDDDDEEEEEDDDRSKSPKKRYNNRRRR